MSDITTPFGKKPISASRAGTQSVVPGSAFGLHVSILKTLGKRSE
jgi:hypothetical protein